jgi:hypothetical protein
MTSSVPLQTCWAFNERWNNKFCYRPVPTQTWLWPVTTCVCNQRLQIQLELLMMSGVPLETCWAVNERWNNKFCYKVAFCWLFLRNYTTMHGSMNIKLHLLIRYSTASRRTRRRPQAVHRTTVRHSGMPNGYKHSPIISLIFNPYPANVENRVTC